jgi:hypothetical protein
MNPFRTLICMLWLAATPWLAGQSVENRVVTTRSVAANRVAELPGYASVLSDTQPGLIFGIESRSRYENRWNDYTTDNLLSEDAFLTRNLLFAAVRGPLDPLRLGLELEDSRRFFSGQAANPNLQTGFEFLQAYAQLYFNETLHSQPLSISLGRFAFDAVDRRLIARNRNRNTINAFDGLRVRLGDEGSRWELESFALRPVKRLINSWDRSARDSTLLGISGYWRGQAPAITLEPYWLWLDQNESSLSPIQRDLHTIGLHLFGYLGPSENWDYDLSLAGQWGRSQTLQHLAWAGHFELGHRWNQGWKPRLASWLNLASGDRDPADGTSQRFDPLFGATYAFYGFSSYFSWQNMVNPALYLSFQPRPGLRCELIHRAFWLASSRDNWVRTQRQTDRAGSAYVGQEADLRLVWQVCRNLELDLAYSHFFPGSFASRTGAAPHADFFQVAATLSF